MRNIIQKLKKVTATASILFLTDCASIPHCYYINDTGEMFTEDQIKSLLRNQPSKPAIGGDAVVERQPSKPAIGGDAVVGRQPSKPAIGGDAILERQAAKPDVSGDSVYKNENYPGYQLVCTQGCLTSSCNLTPQLSWALAFNLCFPTIGAEV